MSVYQRLTSVSTDSTRGLTPTQKDSSYTRHRIRITKREKKSELVFKREDYSSLYLDPEFCELYKAHYRESIKDKELRPLDVDHGRYTRLCAAGQIHLLTARCNRKLVGYISFLVLPTLHHGPRWVLAMSDVWFLAKPYRRGMAGVRMFKAAIVSLRAAGVTAVIQESPRLKPIDKLLKSQGMMRTATLWRMTLR